MKFKFIISLVIVAVPLFASTLFAQQQVTTKEFPYIARSVEAMGMGGAYYGKSDSKYAVFYNPAGLTRIKEASVDIIPLTVGLNDNAINNVATIVKSLTGAYTSNEGVANIVNALMLKHTSFGPITFFPAYAGKKYTFGFFSSTNMSLIAYNKVVPEVELRIKSDNGFSFGMANTFLKNDALAIGISFKALARVNANLTYTAPRLVELLETDGGLLGSITDAIIGNGIASDALGFGFLASVGAMYNLPILEPVRPRIALSINDVGFTLFGSGVDPVIPTVNVSLAFSPHYRDIIDTDIVIDVVDVLFQNKGDTSFFKRFNIGAEVRFIDTFIVRVGLHQGYPTAGAGLTFKFFKLNYAYYSEELGAYVGQLRDNRHALELVFRI